MAYYDLLNRAFNPVTDWSEEEEEQENRKKQKRAKTNKQTAGDPVYITHNTNNLTLNNGQSRDSVDKSDLSFALRYLIFFSKASAVCPTGRITLHIDENRPVMVKFPILSGKSFIKFFLAPKMCTPEEIEMLSDSEDEEEDDEQEEEEDDEYDV